MKITKKQLKRIIAEEYAIVHGKQKKPTRKSRPVSKRVKALNEWTKRAYKLLREAGYSKAAAKKNALILRENRKRKVLK